VRARRPSTGGNTTGSNGCSANGGNTGRAGDRFRHPAGAGRWVRDGAAGGSGLAALLFGYVPNPAIAISPEPSPPYPPFSLRERKPPPRVHGPAEIEAAMARSRAGAGRRVDPPPDGFTLVYRTLIVWRRAIGCLLPMDRAILRRGRLDLLNGVDVSDEIQRAAVYIDRIFRAESAGDLPVQEPTKFELVINLKTAKDLDLTVPSSLLPAPTR
jgi:putative ABC transport system substrate-binding protein